MELERLANYYLQGQDGWKESEKDGRRREMHSTDLLKYKNKLD